MQDNHIYRTISKKISKHAFSMIEILVGFVIISIAVLAFTPLMTKKLKNNTKTNANCKNGIEFREETLTLSNFGTEKKVWHPTTSSGEKAEAVNTMTITLVGGGGGGGAGYSPNTKFLRHNGTSLTNCLFSKYFYITELNLFSIGNGKEYVKDVSGNQEIKRGWAGCSLIVNIPLTKELGVIDITNGPGAKYTDKNGNETSVIAPEQEDSDGSCTYGGTMCAVGNNECSGFAKAGHYISGAYAAGYYAPYLNVSDGPVFYGSGNTGSSYATSGTQGVQFSVSRPGSGGGGAGATKFVLTANPKTQKLYIKIGKGGESGEDGEDTVLSSNDSFGYSISATGGRHGYDGSHVGKTSLICKDLPFNCVCGSSYSNDNSSNGKAGNVSSSSSIPGFVTSVELESDKGTPSFNNEEGTMKNSISGGNGGGSGDGTNTSYLGIGGQGGCSSATWAGGCADDKINGQSGQGYGSGGGGGSCNLNKCGQGGQGADGMVKIEYQVKCIE